MERRCIQAPRLERTAPGAWITIRLSDGAVHDDDSWKAQEQVKNSWIGNGFHFSAPNPVTALRTLGPAAGEAT